MKPDIIEQFFIEYYNDALLYSLSLSKNMSVAEELAANAFYKALESADDSIKDFKPWLLTVCRNTYLTGIRKQSRFAELHEHMEDKAEAAIDKIIRNEEYKALYHAVSLLSKEQSEVILLFYFEDLSVKDISFITGKTTTYVKVLLYRAREKLRKILEVSI